MLSSDIAADLEQEVEYLHNYIDIYRLRFEDRWFVDLTVEGDIARRRIAALVLIPFVENAFKHGVVDQASDPIVIRLVNEPEQLVFEVRNRIGTGQRDVSSGIGLVNIRRRLELIYPGRHVLRVEENEGVFQTFLCINFAV